MDWQSYLTQAVSFSFAGMKDTAKMKTHRLRQVMPETVSSDE